MIEVFSDVALDVMNVIAVTKGTGEGKSDACVLLRNPEGVESMILISDTSADALLERLGEMANRNQ